MIRIPFLRINAFTREAFGGNPAAVCPLDSWLPDSLLQAIARENNLSETAFFVPADHEDRSVDFHLRWFTPEVEVDLCGHATLAAGYAILSNLKGRGEAVRFQTRAGLLIVTRDDDRLALDFPLRVPRAAEMPEELPAIMGACPREYWSGGRDQLLVFEDEETVRALAPDFGRLKGFGLKGFVATAPGRDCDFVSRCFFPAFGVDEDPVTGSAHCMLGPYWATRLKKDALYARQLSERGGELWLKMQADRIHIAGHCVEVIAGEMQIPEDWPEDA